MIVRFGSDRIYSHPLEGQREVFEAGLVLLLLKDGVQKNPLRMKTIPAVMVLQLLERGLEARGREVWLFATSNIYNLQTSEKCLL